MLVQFSFFQTTYRFFQMFPGLKIVHLREVLSRNEFFQLTFQTRGRKMMSKMDGKRRRAQW